MINVGFIGAGDISLLHYEAIKNCNDANLKGIWTRTKKNNISKSKLYNCLSYDSAEDIINDKSIDCIFILTNYETHHYYAKMALEKGKHVLIEKPTAKNVNEIEDILNLSTKKKLQCMPVHNCVYEESMYRTKDLIDNGKLGDIVSFYMLYNIHHPEEVAKRYPGVIRQILTHHVYTTMFMVGRPQWVSCMRSTINDGTVPQENLAMATLKMENGSLAHLNASFAANDNSGDPWSFFIKIIGTKGATRFSHRDWIENQPGAVHHYTFSAYPYSIRNTANYFLQEVLTNGKKPLSTLEDAIICQKVVEACELSSDTNKFIQIS